MEAPNTEHKPGTWWADPEARAFVERVAYVLSLSALSIALQAMGASEGVVGGAVGAAVALAMPNGTRGRVIASSGAGAVLGLVLSGWTPAVIS